MPEPDPSAGGDTVEIDLRTIVGGNYTVDALGYEAYQQLKERVLANPSRFLERLEALIDEPGVLPAWVYPANLLEIVKVVAPDQARRTGEQILSRLEGAIVRESAGDDSEAAEAVRRTLTHRTLEIREALSDL